MTDARHPSSGCALARLIPDALDTEKVKGNGWNDLGILVVAISDPRLNAIERAIVRQIGDKLFGAKKGGQHGGR